MFMWGTKLKKKIKKLKKMEEGNHFFITEDENQILTNALKVYPYKQGLPDEDIFLAQLKDELSRFNSTWDERKIRIWLLSKSQLTTQTFNQQQSQDFINFERPQSVNLTLSAIPPKKRIAANVPQKAISAQVSQLNSPVTDTISTIFNKKSLPIPLTQEEQKSREYSQTKTIELFKDRKWSENVAPVINWPVINCLQTLPSSTFNYTKLPLIQSSEFGFIHPSFKMPKGISPAMAKFYKGPSAFKNTEYNMIEACCADALGHSAIIDFVNNQHILHNNGKEMTINIDYSPSSMIYHNESRSLFIGYKNYIAQINIIIYFC